MDFFVLPMHGSNIALGVLWLATLGRVVTDYGQQIFEFELNGQTFSGEMSPLLISSRSSFNVYDAYVLLMLLPPTIICN